MYEGEFAELLERLIRARMNVDSQIRDVRRSKQAELVVELSDGSAVRINLERK